MTNAHIDYQIIEKDGQPVFVVVPYKEFMELVGDQPLIPHEVVGKTIKEGMSLVRAWREYLRITQSELAGKLGVTQPALAQMEKPGVRLRKSTLEKLSSAMGLQIELLRE